MAPRKQAVRGGQQGPLTERFDPRRLGARCDICPFAKKGLPNKPVMGEGPARPEGILLGESPGRDEAEVGRPFVGPTGRQLNEELREAGFERSKLFVLNSVCCPPPAQKDEKAMYQALNACSPALVAQLRKFDPTTPVLALGRWAYVALTGQTRGVMHARGFVRADFRISAQPITAKAAKEKDHDEGEV